MPSNIVISAAGAVDHDAFVELAAERIGRCGRERARSRSTPPARTPARARRFERKDTEQYHVCLGGTGLSRHDDRRFALRVLDTIFGGTSSSRLFQEVREQRGLAYAVYSFTSAYQDTGQVGLYVGTRADNLGEALAVVGRRAGQAARAARHRGRALAGQGEPEGTRRALTRVDRRPHEPSGVRDAGRCAAALAR